MQDVRNILSKLQGIFRRTMDDAKHLARRQVDVLSIMRHVLGRNMVSQAPTIGALPPSPFPAFFFVLPSDPRCAPNAALCTP